jgi:hypothetical protein
MLAGCSLLDFLHDEEEYIVWKPAKQALTILTSTPVASLFILLNVKPQSHRIICTKSSIGRMLDNI